MLQVSDFLRYPPPIKQTADTTEIFLKVALKTINRTSFYERKKLIQKSMPSVELLINYYTIMATTAP
jgi:hypothetical protein